MMNGTLWLPKITITCVLPTANPPALLPVAINNFEPVGQFSKEEEVKIYHSLFDHIIGADGLCVYPHCKKSAGDFDFERASFLSDRYTNCFQDSWEELEKTRLALQDAQDDRTIER
jgi:hypothetical protein